jgi:hypothetical protein
MPATKRVSDLQPGDRFSWIPTEWYGPCVLTRKTPWPGYEKNLWDLIFDAKVINPPGRVYGVLGTTRVRILPHSRSDTKSAPGKSAGA